jgi:hypothetical protein
MISIGAIVGGPESSFFDGVLGEFMRHCESEGRLSGEPVTVNVVYHIHGSILPPPYEGVRAGRLSKEAKKMMVQAAVEAEVVALRDRAEVLDYIIDVADEAIGVAKGRFEQAGMAYDVQKDRAFLEGFRELVLGKDGSR